MKFVFKQRMLTVCLAMISCQAFSQNGFQELRDAAFDSSDLGKPYAALTLLYKAQALKGIDTGYKEAVYLDLGASYLEIGKMDSAVSYFLKAVVFFENKNDTVNLIYLYNTLGLIELNSQVHADEALDYFRKQLVYERMLQDTSSVLACFNNIGIAFKRLKQFDSALHYHNLVLSGNYADKKLTARTVGLIASVHSLTGEYDRAMDEYDKSIRQFIILSDTAELFYSYVNKGDCLLQQKQYKKSLYCFEQAQQYFTATTTNNQKVALYHNLAEVYGYTHEYPKAFLYKNMEANIKDSIEAQDIEKVAADTRANIEIASINDKLVISEKERSIANLNSRLTKIKIRDTRRAMYALLIGAIVICLVAFLALRNAALRRKANRILTAQKAKVEALADKLEEANQTKARLFSVISHDLRSPVSSLYASLKMQELKGGNEKSNDTVSSHIMHLLDTLEDLLTWSKSQMDRFILQPVNLRITDLYDDLIELHQDAAAGKQITIENKAERPVKIYTDENLLKTILRNVLANSIHHAPNKSTVMVDAVAEENGVVCTISNEATATDAALLEAKLQTATIGSSKHGLGNVLIKEFTEKLNAGFELSYRDGTVHIHVSVPNLEKNATTKMQQEIISF